MTRQEYGHLVTERTSVQRILESLSDEMVISRHNYSARLSEIDDALTGVTVNFAEPVKTRLTYRGRPVTGSYGISACFGMVATRAYTKAVAVMATSLECFHLWLRAAACLVTLRIRYLSPGLRKGRSVLKLKKLYLTNFP